jgi:hypothetical protein
MVAKMYAVIPVSVLAAFLGLDFAGWVQGDEARSIVATWLASLWTALASLFVNTLFGVSSTGAV